MGQHNEFEPGWDVPNDGWYVEIGDHPDSQNIRDPNRVFLHRGDSFPHTRNRHRKWTRDKNGNM